MTQDEMVEMARQVGWDEHHAKLDTRIQAFAKLVAQHEREACAKLCWSQRKYWDAEACADAIRARGQA
jgi:hypothetical protein